MSEEMHETQSTTPEQPDEAGQSSLNRFFHHQRKAADEAIKALCSLVPPDFRTHSRAAGKEYVESYKVLLNGLVQALDREWNRMRGGVRPESADSSGPSTTGKAKVKIEVS